MGRQLEETERLSALRKEASMSFSDAHFKEKLSEQLPGSLTSLRKVGGGDINLAYKATVSNGRHYFIKTHPAPPPHFFTEEARGLSLLAQTNTVGIPHVIAVVETTELSCLILEWVDVGQQTSQTSHTFGRELALLHRSSSEEFGLNASNYIGTLEQSNQPTETWHEFYRDYRLAPLLERAHRSGVLPSMLFNQSHRLLNELVDLAGPAEKPSLLHGDLWGGNRLVDRHGKSWLVDPAVYFGHREVDLAMMRLFGGFNEAVFSAYNETFPLSSGWQERIPLYQLYPMLVHLNLFGGNYLSSVEQIIRRYT